MKIMKIVIILGAVISIALTFHLEKAKVIDKEGEFNRKRTKFGDVYLHREYEDG